MFRLGNRSAPPVDLELQPTINAGTSTDNERLPLPAGGHEREASGQSLFSNMSVRLANMRARERSEDFGRIIARNQASSDGDNANSIGSRVGRFWTNVGSGANHFNNVAAGNGGASAAAPATRPLTGRARRQYEADLEASAAAVVAMGLARGDAGPALFPNDELAQAALRRATTRRAIKTRREREEASTLLGPNVAHYFGSGSSSSGAIINAGQPVGVDHLASPSTPGVGAIGENGFAFGSLGRRVRLGSRGRARGASLSGLGQVASGESLDTNGAPLSASTLTFPGIRARDSSVSLGLGEEEGPNMAEGMDLQTLHSWIERSAGVGPLTLDQPLDATDLSAPGPAICTTLQAYVNLKRNTVRLAPVVANDSTDATGDFDPSSLPSLPSSPITGQAGHGNPSLMSTTQASNMANPRASLITHTLHFEYDCAAPFANVNVFIRASRKHGSWASWAAKQAAQPGTEESTFSKSFDALFALRCPPPHVLGWPVHSTRIRRGFGKANKAELVLHLQLYAPPNLAAPAQPTDGESKEVLADDAIPANDADAEGDLANYAAIAAAVSEGQQDHADAVPAPPSTTPAESTEEADIATAAPAPQSAETAVVKSPNKKKKDAKEDKETLKLAVVVEALDEDGKPLREPNLQTTYMRLTSVPVRLQSASSTQVQAATTDISAAEKADGGQSLRPPEFGDEQGDTSSQTVARRLWSVQVEGQEAEIGQHRFQLQELYGLSTRPPPVGVEDSDHEDGGATADKAPAPVVSPADMEGSNGSECLICLSAPPTTLLLPCTHGLCLECAVQLRESTKATRESERRRGRVPRRKYACPVCRRGYTGLLHLSSADEKALAQTRV